MAPYQAGDVILKCSPFLASGLADDEADMTSRCFVCQRSASPLVLFDEHCAVKRCSMCKQVAYCSKECQQRDWIAVHQRECEHLAAARRNPLIAHHFLKMSSYRELGRCVLLLGKAAELKKKMKKKQMSAKEEALVKVTDRFMRLDAHWDEFTATYFPGGRARKAPFAELPVNLRLYLAGNTYAEKLSDAEVFAIQYRIFYHRNKIGNVRGKVLCVEVAELSHSCNPNASVVFREDGLVYVIANRSIEKDADVRISYMGAHMPLQMCKVRRDFLHNAYFFDCTCALCDGELVSNNAEPTHDSKLRSIRCYKAFTDGIGACDAPLPLTSASYPAVTHCANGHRQDYTEPMLTDYRVAHFSLFAALQNPTAYNDVITAISNLTERYWHPITAIPAGQCVKSYQNALSDMSKKNMQKAWSASSLGKSYSGLGGRLADYLRHIDVDPYQLFNALLEHLNDSLMKAPYGEQPIDSGTAEAVAEVLSTILPLAERYLGAHARRTQAIRRAAAAPYDELVIEGKRIAAAVVVAEDRETTEKFKNSCSPFSSPVIIV